MSVACDSTLMASTDLNGFGDSKSCGEPTRRSPPAALADTAPSSRAARAARMVSARRTSRTYHPAGGRGNARYADRVRCASAAGYDDVRHPPRVLVLQVPVLRREPALDLG